MKTNLKSALASADDQLAGTLLLIGLAAAGIAAGGAWEFLNGPAIVLPTLGLGTIPLVGALALLFWIVLTKTRSGPLPRLAAGFVTLAIGGALVSSVAVHAVNLGLAVLVLGVVIVRHGLVTHFRDKAGLPTPTHDRLDVAVFGTWAFLSVAGGDPLLAIRLAALLVPVHWAAAPLSSVWEGAVAWWQAKTAAPPQPVPMTAPEPDEETPVAEPKPAFTPEQMKVKLAIEEFIRNTQGDRWPDPTVTAAIEATAITTYVLHKPDVADAGRFMSQVDNLAIKLGVSEIGLDIRVSGQDHGLLVQIAKPLNERGVIWFDDLLARVGDPPAGQPFRVCLGLDRMNEPVFADMTGNDPHMLIAGTTGSGKTILMHSILAQMFEHNSPEELQLAVIDPKMVSGALYARAGAPHLWADVVTEVPDAPRLMEEVDKEMQRRYRLFSEAGVVDRIDWNAKFPDQHIPALLFLLDEAASLTEDASVMPHFQKHIGSIAMKGRGAGVFLIIGIQRPSQKNLSENVRGMLNQRIALKVAGINESKLALAAPGDDPSAMRLGGNGDGYHVLSGEMTRFLGAWLPDKIDLRRPDLTVTSRIEAIVAKWGNRRETTVSRATSMAHKKLVRADIASQHTDEIDDETWFVLRGLEIAFEDIPDANQTAVLRDVRKLSPDALVPLVERAVPDGYDLTRPIDAARIRAILSGERFRMRPDTDGAWPLNKGMVSDIIVGPYRADPKAKGDAERAARPRPRVADVMALDDKGA
jgi:hypothetical protein